MKARILVIDDEQDLCDLLTIALERDGCSVQAYTSARAALDHLATENFDAVLTDLGMSEMGGIEVCERIAGMRPGLPVIVVTGQVSIEAAIAAMRAGAYDFVTKPISDPALITLAVARAVEHYKLRGELGRLRAEVEAAAAPSGIVGSSAAMRRVHDVIGRIAAGDASVLVFGETGTGKELVARRIHATGPRKDGPFVAINCAAIPPTLLESELFGHARGAFTDAKAERAGLFLQANRGTLFLDEVAEMPLEMQAKLLRALQERKVRPVGSNNEVPFDARLVTATNRDLEEEVTQKRFREDLFYRINVVRLSIPPLRERASDVLELALYFLKRHADHTGKPALGLSPEAAKKLAAYAWPGNVRELENCMERAVAFARSGLVVVDDLPEKIGAYVPDRFAVVVNDANEILPLDEVERRYVSRALGILGNNKTRAAELLGVDRRTLYRKIDRWESLQGGASAGSTEPNGGASAKHL
jgi:two-component system response regulator HydG